MKGLNNCYILPLIAAAFCGCSSVRLHELPKRPAVTEPAAGPRYGLALSGGGIRSGAVSLGVLQTLQASNVLSEFEYVSSVSGGGYPVYGLLYQMLRNGESLTNLLSDDGSFVRHAETNANFISRANIYGTIPLLPLWTLLGIHGHYGIAQPTYGAEIHETFAGESMLPIVRQPDLADAKSVQKRGFPMPVFGASASLSKGPPKKGYQYQLRDFFELSPGLSGSPSVGYFHDSTDAIKLIDAVTISAAAIDSPQGELQLPGMLKAMNFGLGSSFSAPTQSKTNINFYLADGGFIENLGILPLLRRGCTDILVFDNSADSALFDAWFEFERRLACEEPGWTVSQRLQSPDRQAPSRCKCDQWNLPSHIWSARLTNGKREVRVTYVKLGINSNRLEAYPSAVTNYAVANWSASAGTNWIKGMPLESKGAGLNRHCPFPVESTSDQSYTPDEFRAYRLLGKWLAEQAIPGLEMTRRSTD